MRCRFPNAEDWRAHESRRAHTSAGTEAGSHRNHNLRLHVLCHAVHCGRLPRHRHGYHQLACLYHRHPKPRDGNNPSASPEKPPAIEGQLQGNYTPLPGEHCSPRRFDGKCIQWSKDLPEAHALHAKPSSVACYQWVFDGLRTYCSEPAQPIPPHAPCTYGDGPNNDRCWGWTLPKDSR
jgi:hypothetical protein